MGSYITERNERCNMYSNLIGMMNADSNAESNQYAFSEYCRRLAYNKYHDTGRSHFFLSRCCGKVLDSWKIKYPGIFDTMPVNQEKHLLLLGHYHYQFPFCKNIKHIADENWIPFAAPFYLMCIDE